MIVDRGHGRHHEWMITMNNGLSCVAESWIHYLADCHLKPGDEVVFFYNIDQHLWEVLYRKQVKWDQEEDEATPLEELFNYLCLFYFYILCL